MQAFEMGFVQSNCMGMLETFTYTVVCKMRDVTRCKHPSFRKPAPFLIHGTVLPSRKCERYYAGHAITHTAVLAGPLG